MFAEVVLICLLTYFFPSIVAAARRKKNLGAIFALNLLLGWTFIAWVIALVWSLTHDDKSENKYADLIY